MHSIISGFLSQSKSKDRWLEWGDGADPEIFFHVLMVIFMGDCLRVHSVSSSHDPCRLMCLIRNDSVFANKLFSPAYFQISPDYWYYCKQPEFYLNFGYLAYIFHLIILCIWVFYPHVYLCITCCSDPSSKKRGLDPLGQEFHTHFVSHPVGAGDWGERSRSPWNINQCLNHWVLILAPIP